MQFTEEELEEIITEEDKLIPTIDTIIREDDIL